MLPVIIVAFIAGGGIGWVLAKTGVTADNALQRHQRQVYIIGTVSLGLCVLFIAILVGGQRSPWVPSFLLLYLFM